MIIIGTFLSNVLAGRILCMIAQTKGLLHYKYINNSANLKVWNMRELPPNVRERGRVSGLRW